MSFGFSVGDFLAVGRLAQDIISCLQDAGGAKSDYQELIRELECLQRAVQHLDKLQAKSPSTNLDSIKYAALICRQPLEEFLRKARKFDKSLGVWSKEGTIKTAVDKLRFGFGHKEEIRKLQNYLNIHVGIINLTLAEYGLEKMDIATGEATAERLHIRERLEDTRSMIRKIGDNLLLQTLVVQSTQSMLTRLFQTLTGELRTSWAALADMVAKVFVSTQQTHGVVQEIRSSLTNTFTRMPYFQDPLMVEDALGFKFPVPSEYDYDLLDVIIKHRFIKGPGSLEVEAGNYEFFQTRNSNSTISKNSSFFPGMAITMAIVIGRPTLTDEACPMPNCDSSETTSPPGGGRVCSSCGVWFSSTKKCCKSLSHLLAAVAAMSEGITEGQSDTEGRPSKWAKHPPVKEDVVLFRNVRVAHPRETSHPESDLTQPSVSPKSSNAPVKQLGVKRKRSTTPFEPLSPMGFDEAVRYVNEVKTRYAATPDVYNQFIEALDSLQTLQTLESLGSLQMGGRAEQKIRETHSKIVDLFENEPDLIERLNSFLPVSSEQDVRRVAQTTNSQNSETRHRIMVRDLKSNLKAVAEMHNMVTRMKSIIFHIYKSPSIDHRLTRLLRTCEKIMARYETATPKKSELSEEIESTFNVKDRTLNDDDFRDMIAHMTTSMVLSFGIWVQFPGDVHIEEEEEG